MKIHKDFICEQWGRLSTSMYKCIGLLSIEAVLLLVLTHFFSDRTMYSMIFIYVCIAKSGHPDFLPNAEGYRSSIRRHDVFNVFIVKFGQAKHDLQNSRVRSGLQNVSQPPIKLDAIQYQATRLLAESFIS